MITSPLTPLQPETLRGNGKYLWLERGVQERGGCAPSPRLSLENLRVILYFFARTLPSMEKIVVPLGKTG